jgi:hypothetical protein
MMKLQGQLVTMTISATTPSKYTSSTLMAAGPRRSAKRMTKVALKYQVGRNVLSYVDVIVVASKKKTTYISDLAETFANMREVGLKINPEKCVFGVMRGKVPGCLVSTKDIEANPDKIKGILQMQPSQTKKEDQKLTSRIAALNRFIVNLVERSLPFFSVLRGSARVEWAPNNKKLSRI